jgi:hypothetical protein
MLDRNEGKENLKEIKVLSSLRNMVAKGSGCCMQRWWFHRLPFSQTLVDILEDEH